MKVICPSCGASIPSDDMNLANMVAKCKRCDSIIDLRTLFPAAGGPRAPVVEPRLPAPTPPGFVVDDSGPGLTITRRWFHPVLFFLVAFCIAWDGFLVFWYSVAFAGNAPWIMVVFPIGHLAVGVGLTYFTIAGFVNRTTINVDAEELTVRHGPLPWFGNRRVPVDDLVQLYSKEDVSQNRRNGAGFSYRVNAVTRAGRILTVVSGLTDQEQARFIEQKLEGYLKIPDARVPGELPL